MNIATHQAEEKENENKNAGKKRGRGKKKRQATDFKETECCPSTAI